MKQSVLVAGIFHDLCLMDIPIIASYQRDEEQSHFRHILKKVYFELIECDLFHRFLKRDIIISYGDVIHEFITEGHKSAKWCGINKHYCLVFSINFHRPYIWSDNYHCKKHLTNWFNITSHYSEKEQLSIRNYRQTFGQLIRNSTTEILIEENQKEEEQEE